jgi:hypothetical protein
MRPIHMPSRGFKIDTLSLVRLMASSARRTTGNIPTFGCMLRQCDETRPIAREGSVYGGTPIFSRPLTPLSMPHRNLNWWTLPKGLS